MHCPEPAEVPSMLVHSAAVSGTTFGPDAPADTSIYSADMLEATKRSTEEQQSQEPVDIGMHESSFVPLWSRMFSGIDEVDPDAPERASEQCNRGNRPSDPAKSKDQHTLLMGRMPCASDMTRMSRSHDDAESLITATSALYAHGDCDRSATSETSVTPQQHAYACILCGSHASECTELYPRRHACGNMHEMPRSWGPCKLCGVRTRALLLGESGDMAKSVFDALQSVLDVHVSDGLMHFECVGPFCQLSEVR